MPSPRPVDDGEFYPQEAAGLRVRGDETVIPAIVGCIVAALFYQDMTGKNITGSESPITLPDTEQQPSAYRQRPLVVTPPNTIGRVQAGKHLLCTLYCLLRHIFAPC